MSVIAFYNTYNSLCAIQRKLFGRNPEKYASIPVPTKFPPPPDPIGENELLNIVPFLESEVGPYLLRALMELLEFRPKYPLLGYSESALTFIATYLKGIVLLTFLPFHAVSFITS